MPKRSAYQRIGAYQKAAKARTIMSTSTSASTRDRSTRLARIKAQLSTDHKFYDTVFSATSLSASAAGGVNDPSAGCLSAPAQGGGATDRIGDEIAITSVHIRGMVYFAAQLFDPSTPANIPVTPAIRIALVQDNQTNQTQMLSTDLYATGTSVITALRNMSNTRRFTVLKEIDYSPEMVTTSGYGTANACYTMARDWYWQIDHVFKTPVKVRFEVGATSADVANVIDKSLHLIAYTSNTDMDPQILYNARIRFVG